VATRSAHVPIDFALYLPERWTGDPVRREECKIPTDVVFRTKHDLALEMITRAVDDAVPGDVLLGDSGYGDSHNFRETVRILGFDYALGIHATTTMWRLDSQERRGGQCARHRARAGPEGISPRHVARGNGRGQARQNVFALRVLPREGRQRRRFRPRHARADLVDRRMARGREGGDQVRAHDAQTHDEQEGDRPYLQGALSDRVGLRGDEGRTRPRPLRRSQFPRLEPPRDCRALLLRLRHRRANAAFPPHGRTARSSASARNRGLNSTSPTPSRPSAARSRT